MKKGILFIFFSIMILTSSVGQQKIAKSEDVSRFFTSTTYVVLSNDNMIMDAFVREVLPTVWTATPYVIIGPGQFGTMRTDPEKSFLLFSRVTYSKDAEKNPYIYLTLLMGDKKALNDIDQMAEIAFVPFGCEGGEGELEYAFLSPLLNFIQMHAQRMVKKDFLDNFGLDRHRKLNIYNENLNSLRGKTILLTEDNVDMTYFNANKNKFTEWFGDALQIVSSEEIEQAINEKRANTVVVNTVFPEKTKSKGAFTYNYLINTDDNMICYYEYYKANKYKGLCKNDFENLRKPFKK